MTVIAINCMEARPNNFHFRSDARASSQFCRACNLAGSWASLKGGKNSANKYILTRCVSYNAGSGIKYFFNHYIVSAIHTLST